jgi:hypothetical protein
MFFKFTNRNPFRDLLRNARRVATSELSDTDKIAAYRDLHRLIYPRLIENERFLNSQPAFSKRAEHWNQNTVSSIRPVRNERNPWLRFKLEFEQAITDETLALRAISTALAWFYNEQYADDWIND